METTNRAGRDPWDDGPPAEGALIKRWRERRGLGLRGAASAAGISHTRWFALETGRRPGGRIHTRGKPETYAMMAIALGLTPEDVESEAEMTGYKPAERQRLAGIVAAMRDRVQPSPRLAVGRVEPDAMLTLEQAISLLGTVISLSDPDTLRRALQHYGLIPPDKSSSPHMHVS